MNRIQPLEAVTEAPLSATDPSLDWAVFQHDDGPTPCSLFAPLHYESNYAYPLLVWLHGPGGDERQLKKLMPLVSMRNYVGLGIRGTAPNAGAGYTWIERPDHVAHAEQRVLDAVDLARGRFHIHARRIYLAGFDVGGTLAFRLALANPDRFAGVLSVGGRFPRGQTPLARIAEARRIPLLLACGRDSLEYPTCQVCADLRLFHAAGMNVALRQYPCGHEIDTLMLADMDRWIMEQVTGANCCPAESRPLL